MKICAVIPSYNHSRLLSSIIQELLQHKIKVFLIDDGSNQVTKQSLANILKEHSNVELVSNEKNSGKGFSVCKGFRIAHARGFSHAIQIDADGQHNLKDLPRALELCQLNNEAVISGIRELSKMPPTRRRGRQITDFWVKVNTLGSKIKDSMCGFRIYPLDKTIELIKSETIGARMDFDTEILVRLYWRRINIVQFYTDVCYENMEASSFDLVKDNIRISLMHSRLFFGMLLRAPALLQNKATITTVTGKESINLTSA